jgi:uncharacterized protein
MALPRSLIRFNSSHMNILSRKQLKSLFLVTCILQLGLSFGCKKKTDAVDCSVFDRQAYLKGLVEHSILPAYQDYQLQADSLNQCCQSFVVAPDLTTLAQCRSKLHAATMAWQNVAMFDFGPAEELALQATTNVYPTDTALIQTKISTSDFEIESVSNFAARGLPAIDYMLFGPLSFTDQEVVDQFTISMESADRREFLTILSETLSAQAHEVYEMWSLPGLSFQDDFTSNTGTDLGSSLGLFLNAFNKSYETHTRTQKVGIPVGALTFSQTPLPDRVEAYFGQSNSQDYLMESVLAFENLFLGQGYDGENYKGLDSYLASLDAQYNGDHLNTEIINRIQSVKSGIALVTSPLSEYVDINQVEAFDLYADTQQLNVLWKVDMMSALGILITYQDNDGD